MAGMFHYGRSPSLWARPSEVPALPEQAMRDYPASPTMWEGRLAARETALRELAAQGDRDAAAALAALPGEVVRLLGSNPAAADTLVTLDWVAGRYPEPQP